MTSNDGIARKLKRATVGIAGLGGLGSNVAMALARAGVGRLVLVDHDIVEAGNLSRQAYDMEQVGMRKTEALADNIHRANPWVDVTAVDMRLERGKMHLPFRDTDVVVEALDSADTKAVFIEEIMLKLPSRPLVAASGVAGIGGSGNIEMTRSGNLYLVHDDSAPSSDDGPLLAPRVGLFACWQANIVLEILVGGNDPEDD